MSCPDLLEPSSGPCVLRRPSGTFPACVLLRPSDPPCGHLSCPDLGDIFRPPGLLGLSTGGSLQRGLPGWAVWEAPGLQRKYRSLPCRRLRVQPPLQLLGAGGRLWADLYVQHPAAECVRTGKAGTRQSPDSPKGRPGEAGRGRRVEERAAGGWPAWPGPLRQHSKGRPRLLGPRTALTPSGAEARRTSQLDEGPWQF